MYEIWKRLIHIQSNKHLQFPCNLLSRQRLHYFPFCEFFRADQERLTFERLDLLVSVRLPSKFSFSLRAYRCYFV